MVEPLDEDCMFKTFDGIDLFERSWLPEKDPKAVIVLVHGLADHSGRYQEVAGHLIAHRYALEAFDLRGHGKSGGHLVYVHTFNDYVQDLEVFLGRVKKRWPKKPLFLAGFSMGGTIVGHYLIKQPELRGAILSAPAVKISDDISPLLQRLSSVIGFLFPKLPTVKLDSSALSRDPQVVESYDSDPLVYRKGTPARTGAELIKATKFLRAHMGRIVLPLLILSGSADRLTDVAGSQQLYNGVLAGDKILKLYHGFYHEVMHEPEKDLVIKDMLDWLDVHVREAGH